MDIEFVGHACLCVGTGTTRVICDPWLHGTAFNNGWSLLSTPAPVDWSRVTHLWFSHEHPDHFHPPSILSIPEAVRPGIEVLYQRTRDRKIVKWCAGNGFQVRELPRLKPVRISPSLTVTNGTLPTGDSWLLFDDGRTRFLNLNDCETKTDALTRSLAARVGPIDVMAAQFSYASWVGDTREERLASARQKRDQLCRQAEILKPASLIPFASFARFSHPESADQNDGINRIDRVFPEMQDRLSAEIVVMYPGDRWRAGELWDNSSALHRYARDYERIDNVGPAPTNTFAISELSTMAEVYARRLKRNNPLLTLFPPEPATVWLTDHAKAVSFDISRGLSQCTTPEAECDIAIASDTMAAWFANDWGGATVYISGRMKAPDRQRYRRAYRYFYISNANNRGESWPWFDIQRRIWRRLQSLRA